MKITHLKGMMMARRKSRRRNQTSRVLLTLFLLVVGVLGYLLATGQLDALLGREAPAAPVEGRVEFHFIDVGQGDAALIRTAEGNVLIDAGTNASEDELIAYLKAEGITELAYAVFTHPHEDHIGGADAVLAHCVVKNVIRPDVEASSKTYQRMVEAIEAEGAKEYFSAPDQVYTLGDLKMTILGPVGSDYDDVNNESIVMRVDFGESSVLYTGDAEDVSEEEMLSRYAFGNKLDCDLLKVGHHGSDSSSTEAFLRAVTPEMAVISCGTGNDYGHPKQEILSRLESMEVIFWRTDLLGDVVVVSDGKTLVKE